VALWEHFVGGGVAVFDCNGDGFDDLYMAGGKNPAQLFVNETGEAGATLRFSVGDVAPLTQVTGAYPLDIDSDGVLDLAVLRVGANMLLKGGGDCTFSDASAAWGFDGGDRWTTAFSATWEAGQAWPTLAFGNYVDRDDPDGPFEACDANELHRHDGSAYGLTPLEPGFCALSILFSDWNRDGTQDLRMSNDRHYYVSGGSEQMWSMPDVLTSMGDQLMQIATENGYEAAPFGIGSYAHRPYTGDDGRPSTGWHAQFGDVNNDARPDLFIAKGNVDQMPGLATKDPNNLLMQGADGVFSEAGDVAGIANFARSRGAGLVDLNNDGLLDIVVVNRRAEAELYQSVSSDAGNWLAVSPRLTGANRNAVGAWVEVRAGGVSQEQEVTVGGGHASGQSTALHFGLGTAERAELRVLWPDGSLSEWQSVAVNERLVVSK